MTVGMIRKEPTDKRCVCPVMQGYYNTLLWTGCLQPTSVTVFGDQHYKEVIMASKKGPKIVSLGGKTAKRDLCLESMPAWSLCWVTKHQVNVLKM